MHTESLVNGWKLMGIARWLKYTFKLQMLLYCFESDTKRTNRSGVYHLQFQVEKSNFRQMTDNQRRRRRQQPTDWPTKRSNDLNFKRIVIRHALQNIHTIRKSRQIPSGLFIAIVNNNIQKCLDWRTLLIAFQQYMYVFISGYKHQFIPGIPARKRIRCQWNVLHAMAHKGHIIIDA